MYRKILFSFLFFSLIHQTYGTSLFLKEVDSTCAITLIPDPGNFQFCISHDEVFVTTLSFTYAGTLPATIESITSSERSDEGFEITSYSPMDIDTGYNHITVFTTYSGPCLPYNKFVCDVTGGGGANECTLSLGVFLPCCDNNCGEEDSDGDGIFDDCDNCPETANLDQADDDNDGVGNQCDCEMNSLISATDFPDCIIPNESFDVNVTFQYNGTLPAAIDSVILLDETSTQFAISNIVAQELIVGLNSISLEAMLVNGTCNDNYFFAGYLFGTQGASSCEAMFGSELPCCATCPDLINDDLGVKEICNQDFPYSIILPNQLTIIDDTGNSMPSFIANDYGSFMFHVIDNNGCIDSTTIHIVEMDCPRDCGNIDTDQDNIFDQCDNCPTVPNPNQVDDNNNGIGDRCEDSCSDIIFTVMEEITLEDCIPSDVNFDMRLVFEYIGPLPVMLDSLFIMNGADPSFEIIDHTPEIFDGINILNIAMIYNGTCMENNGFTVRVEGLGGEDACPFSFMVSMEDTPCCMNECGTKDMDNDGVYDLCDNCPNTRNTSQIDVDGDGQGDICDPCIVDPLNLCGEFFRVEVDKDFVKKIEIDSKNQNTKHNHEDLTLYPNPIQDHFTIYLNEKVIDHAIIYNSSGNIVSLDKAPKGKTKITMITQELSVGIYYVLVVTVDGQRYIQKISKF